MSEYNFRNILTLHASNDYFAAVLDADPEFLRAVQVRNDAIAYELPAVKHPTSPLHTDGKITTAWLDAKATATANEARRDEHRQIINQLIRDAEQEIVTSVSVQPDKFLAALRTDLSDLFGDVNTAVGKLDGARSAVDSVRAGTADAWRDLTLLRDEYDKIRAAQMAIMVCEPAALDLARFRYQSDPMASDTHFDNLDEFWPQWRAEPSNSLGYTVAGTTPPWPHDAVEQLVWMSTSAAHPWVPTLDQLNQLRLNRHQRANADAREINPKRSRVLNTETNRRKQIQRGRKTQLATEALEASSR